MGWGPTAIIGAKLARPDKACVAITGDGGFLMVNQEVSTAVEWGLPVVWLVFNNSSLAAIRDGQMADFGGRVIGTEYSVEVDYAELGRALGGEGVRVTRHNEVEDAIRWALDCGKPCVVDLVVAADAVRPPIAGRVVRARPLRARAHAARVRGAILGWWMTLTSTSRFPSPRPRSDPLSLPRERVRACPVLDTGVRGFPVRAPATRRAGSPLPVGEG